MATYYVRTDGSDSNVGTGPATNQAWQTITKAIGATGIAPGDTLYIAPGVYQGTFTAAFTNPANEGQRVTIAGNPTASQFSGINAGPVVITNFLTNTTTSAGNVFVIDKDYVTIQDICFTGYNAGGSPYYNIWASTSVSLIMSRCLVYQPTSSTEMYFAYFAAKAGGVGPNISRCVFLGGGITLQGLTHSGTWNSQTTVTDSIFINQNTYFQTNNAVRLQSQTSGQHGGVKIINCYLSAGAGVIGQSQMSTTHPSLVQNCLIEAPVGISALTNNGQITQSYNVIQSSTPLTNVASSGTTITNGFATINASISKIQGWADYPFISALTSAQVGINGGINTNSLVSDIYGTSWLTPTTPTIGASEFQSYTPSSQYVPTERNASTITIPPGSTSQSIELYLGITGLTASTSGLSARYNRTRTASVSIPLVARTITQAWTSGGFAEVDATNMPGVYRLDLPDAALAAGADDVTIVVRGASGTNGAVMTVKLSSGGLTSAQTASAVWGALTTDHTTHGTFGWNVLRADQDSKQGLVGLHTSGNVNRVDADVHAIVNDLDAATELKGALLHNGTDYISAELLTPVSAATSVHIGPYQLLADGLGADQPLDVNVGTATSIDVQVTDANGTGIDITGATVSAKVYNSGGTLVATYAGTATYADNGRLSFGLTTTVTNTSGTYTVTVTRTTGASDTQVFGPLKLYVRPV
jgi:hypothetical protein